MRATRTKRVPRPKKARTLLGIVGGAVLAASVAAAVPGCGDESEPGNLPDMTVPRDIGNPAVHD